MRLRCWAVFCVTLLGLTSPGLSGDREAARKYFDKAREAHETLLQSPDAERTARKYQAVIRLYRYVLDNDPAFAGCDDALYWTANLYDEMHKRFGGDSYRRRAVYFYNFVAREYPDTKFKGRALERAAALKSPEAAPPRPETPSPGARVAVEVPLPKQTADQAAPPATPVGEPDGDPEAVNGRATVHSVRYWANQGYTRVVIALDREVSYTKEMLSSPDRMYLDLHNSRLESKTLARTYDVNDLFIKQIRVGVNRPGTVRVVLDFAKVEKHSLFSLYDPFRLVIDTRGDAQAQASAPASPAPPSPAPKLKTAEAEIRLEPGPAKKEVMIEKPVLPSPKKKGDLSLTRTLGLKVGRVVLDPGHGGKDTGSIGPTGLLEKDLVLDVALRLKVLLEERLGTDVVLTRSSDQFVPLEERTAIANQHNADLFISIHANSSRSRRVAGSETFFLSFASTSDEQEVASRENAGSQRNIRELEDLLKQIALGDYHAESRQLAELVQSNLHKGMRAQRPNQRNRGVKKAPFIVLIGANMPSILSEVAFISNTGDEKYLKQDRAKSHIAESLYRGVAAYFRALGTLPLERSASAK